LSHQPLWSVVRREFKHFFEWKPASRVWHIPLLASFCVGGPLLLGLALGNLQAGLVACMAGLVILYVPAAAPPGRRIVLVMASSFGFLISYTVGITFSFHPLLSALVLGVFVVCVHGASVYFRVPAPGSFFFVMIAAMASCLPNNPATIPTQVGLMGLGSMFACLLAFTYIVLDRKRVISPPAGGGEVKDSATSLGEALILGFFVAGSLAVGHLLGSQNPYWIPVSCAAVMQGLSVSHVWRRVIHRILGTFVGLGVCWTILTINSSPWALGVTILVLQFIIEVLVVRHYGSAVVFITPLTILLSEAAHPLIHDPNQLISQRFWDISLGSLIGAVGGWVLFHPGFKASLSKLVRWSVGRGRRT